MIKRRFTDYIALPIMTLLLIVMALTIFVFTYFKAYSIVENTALVRLDDATENISREISGIFENNEVFLSSVADNLSSKGQISVKSAVSILQKYSSKIKATRISIILPDDRIVTIDGMLAPTSLHFDDIEREIYEGETFSRVDISRLVKDQSIFRQYVPIMKDDEMIGIAYAVYTCDGFADFVDIDAFDGNASFFLFDRRDGSTAAYSTANPISGLSYLNFQYDKEGNPIDTSSIKNGRSGNILYVTHTNGEPVYMSYTPTSDGNYSVAVNVYEKVVMSDVYSYRRLYILVGIIEVVVFLLYASWVLYKTRSDMKRMSSIARTDMLTGVRNTIWYSQVTAEYDEKIANGEELAFAVIMCDINGLKEINDTLGHSEGDRYIKRCVEVINSAFHRSFIYRIGGDEFVVILDGNDYLHREDSFAYLKNLISDKLNFSVSKQDRVSYAAGMSEYIPGKDKCFKDVQVRADEMMYENKRAIKAKRRKNENDLATGQGSDTV